MSNAKDLHRALEALSGLVSSAAKSKEATNDEGLSLPEHLFGEGDIYTRPVGVDNSKSMEENLDEFFDFSKDSYPGEYEMTKNFVDSMTADFNSMLWKAVAFNRCNTHNKLVQMVEIIKPEDR